MAALAIQLPEDVKRLAEVRAREAGYDKLDDYLAALVRADAEQDVSDELEQALLDGINSGESIEVTPEFWAELKRRGRDRQSGAKRP